MDHTTAINYILLYILYFSPSSCPGNVTGQQDERERKQTLPSLALTTLICSLIRFSPHVTNCIDCNDGRGASYYNVQIRNITNLSCMCVAYNYEKLIIRFYQRSCFTLHNSKMCVNELVSKELLLFPTNVPHHYTWQYYRHTGTAA